MYIININALDTEKAIPLCKSANFAYQLLGQLLKTDSYRAGSLEHTLYSHEISKLSRASV